MKNQLIIIFALMPYVIFAQSPSRYPAPTNFEYTFDYISLDEWGTCADEYIEGPSYCSNFSWNTPDTVGLSTNLKYYNIHVLEYYNDSNTTNHKKNKYQKALILK